MASAGGVVQSDVFHLEFNRITTPATEPFNRLEQKMALDRPLTRVYYELIIAVRCK